MHYTEKKGLKKAAQTPTIKKVLIKKQDEVTVHLKQETPTVRYLKIQPFCPITREYKLHRTLPGQIVSELRLCGKWLKSAGFNPNDYASVTVVSGLLVIRLTPKTMEEVQLDTEITLD
jgi:hypothetical protein